MKWYVYVIALSLIASTRFAVASDGTPDTLDLMGGNAFDWGIGWMGGAEAYLDSGWCGDTINRDSGTVFTCYTSDFIPDTGGLTSGSSYINWKYKFRNYYAQLPIVWDGWRGVDSATVSGYKYLLITYKGFLPSHFANLEFFYASYGSNQDTTKDPRRGDGVGTVMPSPNGWTTITIKIPDSVSLPGISGLVFGIANQTNMGGKTSEVGNIKVDRISLMKTGTPGVATRYLSTRKAIRNNRFYFMPSSGSVTFCAYSLNGEVLAAKTVSVSAGKQYSVRQFAAENCGALAPQIRLVKIKGEGVNITSRMW